MANHQTMTTIYTFQDNGPYFPPSKGLYQAARLKDLLFHVRQAMEDREDTIAIFDQQGSCKGIWCREVEGHVDSAGDSIVDHEGYELMRPKTKEQWLWNRLQEKVQ